MSFLQPIDNFCGECGEPVLKNDRQQVYFYPEYGGMKRVCAKCLIKLTPQKSTKSCDSVILSMR
jgi:hypothetical protein